MRRVKLKIKRLESTSNRQVTYSKRRSGILKKAKELSILCDIDIVLLMFSPTGRLTVFNGARSNIEKVIAKFAQLPPQERTKRKLESLEALKKTFKKLDHDVNIEEFLGAGSPTVEELTDQLTLLQGQLSEVHNRLSHWNNLDKIDNIEHLSQMEDSLRESLNGIHIQKENFGNQQIMSLEASYQFQNGMHLPSMFGNIQEAQTLHWHPNNEDQQHMILTSGPSFLPQRDMECSTSVSFSAYDGYFGIGKQNETNNTGQIEHTDNIGHIGQADHTGQDNSTLNELRLQLSGQYPYPSYSSFNLPDEKRYSETEMNLQSISTGYQVDCTFVMPRPTFDDLHHHHHTQVPVSGSCSMAMYNENAYPQQQN